MNRLVLAVLAICVSFSVQAGGNAEAGKQRAAQVCVACHGADGNKPSAPDQPVLAGQYPDYIVKALKDYKSGKRKNPIMAGIVAGVDAKDFEAIAEFFGQQHGLCSTDELRKYDKCVRDSE
jgi:cytochrome c553